MHQLLQVKFAMKKDIAGIMIWSIDTDDFLGDCVVQNNEKETFPLVRSISHSIIESLQEIEIEKEKEKADAKTELPGNDINKNDNSCSHFSSSVFVVFFMFILTSISL